MSFWVGDHMEMWRLAHSGWQGSVSVSFHWLFPNCILYNKLVNLRKALS